MEKHTKNIKYGLLLRNALLVWHETVNRFTADNNSYKSGAGIDYTAQPGTVTVKIAVTVSQKLTV